MNTKDEDVLVHFLKSEKSKKNKICFLTCEYPPSKGGISKSAGRVSKFLVEAGYELHVFTPNFRSRQFEVEVSEAGLYIYYLPTDFLPHFYDVISVVDNVLRFDLFHGFSFSWSTALLSVIEFDQRPLISSIRGIEAIEMKEQKLKRMHSRRILKRSSWVTSVSSDSLLIASKVAHIKRKSCFIPNSINIEVSDWEKSNENTGVIGTIAVFRDKKNIPLLIEAYSLIPKHLRTKLLLIGDYSDKYLKAKADIEETINRLDLSSEIVITGYVSNEIAIKYLKLVHVFVISSDHEGLPNTLFEAAASGVPIVATAVDGIKDVCVNHDTALLVPPKDVNEMAKAIQAILTNDMLGNLLSAGGKRMVAKYSLNYEKEQWLNIYTRLLDN